MKGSGWVDELMQNPLEYSLEMSSDFWGPYIPKRFEFGEHCFESIPRSQWLRDVQTGEKLGFPDIARRVTSLKDPRLSLRNHVFTEVPMVLR